MLLRHLPYFGSIVLTLLSLVLVAMGHRDWIWVLVIAGALAALGTWDLLQKKATSGATTRSSRISATGWNRLGRKSANTSSRATSPKCRSRAISVRLSTSGRNRSATWCRSAASWMSTATTTSGSTIRWRPRQLTMRTIASSSPACAQPYASSVFNISAMSFGSLSANAIRALNWGRSAEASRTIPARFDLALPSRIRR